MKRSRSIPRRLLASVVLASFVASSVTLPITGQLPSFVPEAAAQAKERDELALMPLAKRDGIGALVGARIEEYLRAMITAGSVVGLTPSEVVRTGRPQRRRNKKNQASRPDSPAVRALEKADQGRLTARTMLQEKKDPRVVIKLLKTVIKRYERNYVELVDFTQLVDAYGRSAAAALLANKPGTAVALLKKALTLQPTYVANRGEKTLQQSLIHARKRLEKRPKGSVSVTCASKGAEVYVDGVLLGPPPVVGKDLYMGTHYVQVRHPKAKPWGQVIQIRGREVKVDAKLSMREDPADNITLAVKPADILPFANTGNFHTRLVRNFSFMYARQIRARYLLYGVIGKAGSQIGLHLFLFDQRIRKFVALSLVKFDANLGNMQLKILEAEGHIRQAIQKFPKDKVVKVRPAIYGHPSTGPSRRALVAAPPAMTTPARTAPSSTPSPVVKPTPANPTSKPAITSPVVQPQAQPAKPVVKPVMDPYKNLLNKDTSDEPSLVKKPWFWAVLGGVIAAGATTAIIIATQEPEPSPNFKVDALVKP